MTVPRWSMSVLLVVAAACTACKADSSETRTGSAICSDPQCGAVAGRAAPAPECTTDAECMPSQACNEGYCIGAECAISDDTADCPDSCKICVHAGP